MNKEFSNEKYNCGCGSVITNNTKSNHFKSKKHIKHITQKQRDLQFEEMKAYKDERNRFINMFPRILIQIENLQERVEKLEYEKAIFDNHL